jgi:2-methylcitrate dehydratase PrpD
MLRNERPQTALEAKFSLQFAMACSVVARNVGLAQLNDELVCSSPIQSLLPRVSAATTTDTVDGSAFAPSEKVEITTARGQLASEPIFFAKGSKQWPLTSEELKAKFAECLGDRFSAAAKANAFDKLMQLEQLNTAADLLL